MTPENYSIMLANQPGDRQNVESYAQRLDRLNLECEEREDPHDYWQPKFRPDDGSCSGLGETPDERNA